MKRKIIWSVFFVFLFCQYNQASFLDVLQDKLGQAGTGGISNGKIDQGLKEALNVGIKNATRYLGKNNGYFTNAAVKILLPEEVRKAEPVLRSIGFGPELDEFTLSMNRAAEKAAPLARDIFLTAITDMPFDDASRILKGGNTAATDYLKTKTYDKLLELFQPAVRKTMNSYQVTQQYEAISGKVQSLPLVGKAIDPDVNRYVAAKALDGLFYTLAQEETSIRTNPKARVTSLLKEVFK
ncbi:MAG: DUF4197 domain-containing protein [Deltaproteobacteria bacterium HGW-Deltaproteobacteria-6]|jgi:hypothetical protein|nr:MAG: DUF4197 domain-containing protein [Deltaproteobacteria bacterium HGW-Deltaproteobacteria-6]